MANDQQKRKRRAAQGEAPKRVGTQTGRQKAGGGPTQRPKEMQHHRSSRIDRDDIPPDQEEPTPRNRE